MLDLPSTVNQAEGAIVSLTAPEFEENVFRQLTQPFVVGQLAAMAGSRLPRLLPVARRIDARRDRPIFPGPGLTLDPVDVQGRDRLARAAESRSTGGSYPHQHRPRG